MMTAKIATRSWSSFRGKSLEWETFCATLWPKLDTEMREAVCIADAGENVTDVALERLEEQVLLECHLALAMLMMSKWLECNQRLYPSKLASFQASSAHLQAALHRLRSKSDDAAEFKAMEQLASSLEVKVVLVAFCFAGKPRLSMVLCSSLLFEQCLAFRLQRTAKLNIC